VDRSQHRHVAQAIEKYLPASGHIDVLEVGSGISGDQELTHRQLLADRDHSYVGADVREARNVDVVMRRPYTIPARSSSKDLVICGSVFEHVPYYWATMLEIARVLRPGGFWIITVPSRGHEHAGVDCWRMYPDGIRSIAGAARLKVLEVHTHFPPPVSNGPRHDYARIDTARHYWGHTVGVLQKPERYPVEMSVIRPVVRWWANRCAGAGPRGRSGRVLRVSADCSL
jgi:SAM-dependent methyltransferase